MRESDAEDIATLIFAAWRLRPDEWKPRSDELTSTMKVRRDGAMSKYEDRIERLYSPATSA